MLLETLSVREVSEADEKYSAVVSAPYPLNGLNLLLGVYVLSVKSPKVNKFVLHFYFLPTMLVCLVLFVAYTIVILPLAYVKMVFHKFALVVRNPQGVGAKSKSDRLGYAVFFLVFGLLILSINCLFDIFWFLRHVYLSEEEIDKAPLKEKGLMTNSVDRRTFKKMLDYFVKWDEEPGKDQR